MVDCLRILSCIKLKKYMCKNKNFSILPSFINFSEKYNYLIPIIVLFFFLFVLFIKFDCKSFIFDIYYIL